MVFTNYMKQRIIYLHSQGHKAPTIFKLLEEEGLKASRRGIAKFLQRYAKTGTIGRKQGSGPRPKITEEIQALIEERMRSDDETSAVQLHSMLVARGYELSLATILRCRTSLGWTFRGSSYCQLIRHANKTKRLQWTIDNRDYNFGDVIFSDECSVQLETHRRFCCRKVGEKPRNKPR